MKKILISAALVTGLVAPAIFAATQYTNFSETKSKYQNGEWVSASGSIRNPALKCMRWAMSEYRKEKNALAQAYKSKMKWTLESSQSTWTVSWERNMKIEQVKIIQANYMKEMQLLKEKYLIKQRSCTKE